jgi:hypothetical protein
MTHTVTRTAESAHITSPTEASTTPTTPPCALTSNGLEWLGPLAFTRRHAGGVDRDFGNQWGRLGDQRLTVRHPLGVDHGLLYVYDATWDEYAALADDIPLDAVHEAATAAAALDPHTAVTRIARAAVTLGQAAREPDRIGPAHSTASRASSVVAEL